MRQGLNRKRVCLCGSTRFEAAYIKASKDETLKGNIVLSVGMFGHQEGIDMEGQIKKNLDDLHLDKIDLAHEVLVINEKTWVCRDCAKPVDVFNVVAYMGKMRCCGSNSIAIVFVPYIGESTRREIDYAQRTGKPVRYLNPV